MRPKAPAGGRGAVRRVRKRASPRIPRNVALVTSLRCCVGRCGHGASRRALYLGVIIYPVPVQGAGAAAQIAGTLRASRDAGERDAVACDPLVRGGGSI